MSDITTYTTESPLPVEQRPVSTDPTSENIAAYVDSSFLTADRALPRTIDEAERLFGRDIYERMSHDANLAASIRFIKSRVLKGGLSVAPSHKAPAPNEPQGAEKAEKQRKHEQAKECADFVSYCLGRLRLPGENIMEVLYEMLDCLYLGNRLAEINTEIAQDGPYAGDRVLVSVRPKPRENYAFVVKSLGGFVGVCAVIPGRTPYVRQGIIFDPAQLPNMISPDKVMVFRFGGKNGDPRGESLFRDAYNAWLYYQQIQVQGERTTDQFAGGRLQIIVDKDAPSEVNPSQLARDAQQWTVNGVWAGPRGTKGQIEWPQVDPAWIESQARRCREEMVMAILVNARQILSAERGSEKDSGVAQDAGDEVMGWIKDLIQNHVRAQLFYSLVSWKWGKEIADEFTPKAVLGSSISPDFAKNMNAAGSVGYKMDPSQYIPFEEAIGAPVRDPNWQQVEDERAKQQAQQNATLQQPSTASNFRRAGQPRNQAA